VLTILEVLRIHGLRQRGRADHIGEEHGQLPPLAPGCPLVFGARHKALDADLVRVIHGFDSLLVLSASNPSQNR
jgi:hypothetical protein